MNTLPKQAGGGLVQTSLLGQFEQAIKHETKEEKGTRVKGPPLHL